MDENVKRLFFFCTPLPLTITTDFISLYIVVIATLWYLVFSQIGSGSAPKTIIVCMLHAYILYFLDPNPDSNLYFFCLYILTIYHFGPDPDTGSR